MVRYTNTSRTVCYHLLFCYTKVLYVCIIFRYLQQCVDTCMEHASVWLLQGSKRSSMQSFICEQTTKHVNTFIRAVVLYLISLGSTVMSRHVSAYISCDNANNKRNALYRVSRVQAENEKLKRGRLGYVIQSTKKGLVRLPAPNTQRPLHSLLTQFCV